MQEMERLVNKLVEDSAVASVKGELRVALDKAKEAQTKEKALCRHREAHNMADQINIDLTYSVNFNLANQLHMNGLYSEALKTYQLIVKNKQYTQARKLRVNMGNIYYEQKQYVWAIRMYRMALDQIPATGKEMRYKIQRNIGNSFVRMGQYPDAIQSFEAIMEGTPDLQTGFNLLVCQYMLNDKERIKSTFADLIAIKPDFLQDSDDYSSFFADPDREHAAAVRKDDLKEILKAREARAHRYILMAAKLIAPVVEHDLTSGYTHVIEALRSSYYEKVAAEMEIAKAVAFLKLRDFPAAIDTLKAFEKKDHALMAQAATNLSFVYFVQSDLGNAEKYANIAVDSDRYNAKALVNKGNCSFAKGDMASAREHYNDAVSVDADCIEGIYNLGLVYKHQRLFDLALKNFQKVQAVLPGTQEALFQIAACHEAMGNKRECLKSLGHVKAIVPTDPAVLQRLALMYNDEDDETTAYHHFLDAYKHYPVSMEVISWLGGYCVKNELYEKALEYFTRASLIQPKLPNWKLMAASCLRRIGRFQEAFAAYENIHAEFPSSIEPVK
jgi:intraflagellar transport protein 88